LRRSANKFKKCAVLRPNAVFGTPVLIDRFDRWTLIPYSFPLEAVYQQKIVLRSTGEQNRNFVATTDIANCIKNLLLADTGNFSVINPLGQETVSVYQFATRCAKIYRQLTGAECLVERPQPNAVFDEEMFVYQTKHSIYKSDINLDDYLKEIIQKILNDFQNGQKYS
jgi:UDP-glucose 4-epimerase